MYIDGAYWAWRPAMASSVAARGRRDLSSSSWRASRARLRARAVSVCGIGSNGHGHLVRRRGTVAPELRPSDHQRPAAEQNDGGQDEGDGARGCPLVTRVQVLGEEQIGLGPHVVPVVEGVAGAGDDLQLGDGALV